MANELQAISIIVVFITVAFGLLMPKAWEELGTKIDNYEKSAEVRTRTLLNVRRLWLLQSLPLLALGTIPAYLITPRTFSIICQSRVDFWNFDLLATLFVVIAIYLWSGVAVISYTIARLLLRTTQLKEYFKHCNGS